MKLPPSFAIIVLVTAGLLFIGVTGVAEEMREGLNTLPPLVQKAARKLVGKSKVEEVENTFENGKRAYEVEFKRGGKEMAVVISEEGKLIQTENRMSVGDAPKKIQNAVLKKFPNGQIAHIKSVEMDGVIHYEVSVQVEGHAHALKLDKEGNVL